MRHPVPNRVVHPVRLKTLAIQTYVTPVRERDTTPPTTVVLIVVLAKKNAKRKKKNLNTRNLCR